MDSSSQILKLSLVAALVVAISSMTAGARLVAYWVPVYSQERESIERAQLHPVARRDHKAARRLYDRVMEEFRKKDYQAALAGFRLFMALHGDSLLAASAQYWIGECEFRLGRYKAAITAFSQAALVSGQSQKQAAATIKVGLSYSKLGQIEAARIMLERVVVEFPNTAEATVAAKHLKRLPGQDTSAAQQETQKEVPSGIIEPNRASINGIHFGSSEEDILSAFGKPRATERGFDEPMAAQSMTLMYDGVKIYLVEGELYNLSCQSTRCRTADGIKVGATKGKVLSVYGRGRPQHADAARESLSYRINGMDAALIFYLHEGVVHELELVLDYV